LSKSFNFQTVFFYLIIFLPFLMMLQLSVRLHLKNTQINLVFHSVFTNFVPDFRNYSMFERSR
jgi:hypothetical protein